jgi:tetratricopeptide (TPR) repeat protein
METTQPLDAQLLAMLPQTQADMLSEALSRINRRLHLERQLTDGYTEALVMVVYAEGGDEAARKLVLKVGPTTGGSEPDRHNAALAASNTAFAESHLVQQPFAPIDLGDGWTAMFQDIAGGSLTEFRPLKDLEATTSLASAVRVVCDAVLVEWDTASRIHSMGLKEFLVTHVRRKLEDDGSLSQWVRSQFGEKALSAPALRFSDDELSRPLVNPMLVVRDPDSLAGLPSDVNAVVGNAHGDLHPGNILVPMGGGSIEPGSFRLIDLSSFGEAPLTRDPMNLLLSVVAHALPGLDRPDRRMLLSLLTGHATGPMPATLGGMDQLAQQVLSAGTDAMKARGLKDEWEQQQALSLLGIALVFASRDSLVDADRLWFLELAAHVAQSQISDPGNWPQENTYDLGAPLDAKRRTARQAADAVVMTCERFDGSVTTVAVLTHGALTPSQAAALPSAGWDVIFEFDPYTDSGGAYTAVREAGITVRLVQPAQAATFARGTTTWIAAAGLAPANMDYGYSARAEKAPVPRRWRQQHLPGLTVAAKQLAQTYANPAVLVVFGEPGDLERAVVEALLDAFNERLKLLTVGDGPDAAVQAYLPEQIEAEAGLTAGMLPARRAGKGSPLTPPTLPAGVHGDDRVSLDTGQLELFAEVGELLHSQCEVATIPDAPGDRFYRGGTITWFELGLDVDIPRSSTLWSLDRSLRRELAERGTRRVTFTHSPGSGGTTLARRAAWKLRDVHPVIVSRAVAETDQLGARIRDLAGLTQRSVLVVLENSSNEVVNRLYDDLRTDSVPATLLIIARRSGRSARAYGHSGRAPELGPLDDNEREEFTRLFGAMAPSRRTELQRLNRVKDELSVPFFYALTAFQEDFQGLNEYVRRSLENVAEDTRDVLIAIAIAHRYGGLPVPSDLFAVKLGVPRNRPLRLAERLANEADGLLLQEPANSWRTRHPLIAEEILRQLLAPPTTTEFRSADEWRLGLTSRCTQLISWIYDVYDMVLPAGIRQILETLFLLRDNQDGLGSTRSDFSELLTAIPALEGRLEVLRILAETFPEETHFWGHYGRLLSYQAQDHQRAHEAVQRALDLDDRDASLFHIKGMVYRSELRSLTATAPPGRGLFDADLFKKVRELASSGLEHFARAAELNDISEYPHVAAAQLCVQTIEWGYGHSEKKTYAEFLRQPSSQFYADLLDVAEDSLGRVREIAASDRPSQVAQRVEVELREFYDDYAGLLEGWRNLLDRQDVIKAPIRRRLVRTYRTRAGGWRTAASTVIQQALSLLEENLRDDPRDSRSLRDWLDAARYSDVGLDRAAELVSYWVESEPSREALFYDYVLSALFALEGRQTAIEQYRRKVERIRDRVAAFPRKRSEYEWLGKGSGLGALVHNRDLADWQRSRENEPDPAMLRRVEGRVIEIRRPTHGRIEFGPGLSAFFTPAYSQLVAGRDENKRVSALIGFAYEGPQAWSVRLL